MPTLIASPPLPQNQADTPLLTAEEFAQLPEPKDGSREELVRGKVFTMPMPRYQHGRLQSRISRILGNFVEGKQCGEIVTETGLVTEREPDTVRGPDVAYWSYERLPANANVEVYPNVAADLCIEILSDGDMPRRIQKKLQEYFACGVKLVWIFDAEAHTVTVYRQPDQGQLLWENATLSGEDVLPDFECRVGDLFGV